MGVPDSSSRFLLAISATATLSCDLWFLSLWPSSHTTKPMARFMRCACAAATCAPGALPPLKQMSAWFDRNDS